MSATQSVPFGTREVVALVVSLFSADEFDRFLYALPGGATLAEDLPTKHASPRLRAWEAIRRLEREGRLDETFWSLLLAARPRRDAEIAALRATYRTPMLEPLTPDMAADDPRAQGGNRSVAAGGDLLIGGDLILGDGRGRWQAFAFPGVIVALAVSMVVVLSQGARVAEPARAAEAQDELLAPPPLYDAAERAIAIGNSNAAIQLLERLCRADSAFHRGRALLVRLLLLLGDPQKRRAKLTEHLNILSKTPKYSRWADCVTTHAFADRTLITVAELDAACPAPM